MSQVFLYDTTLRDGTQRENLSLSLGDKIKIAQRLDSFGIPYIEGGWPGSNPKDAEFFARVREIPLRQARICAFGSTRYKQTHCDRDANIQALLEARTPVVTLVGKSWDLHVEQVIETTLAENLAMVEDSVRYVKRAGREVVYDAEHFFDGWKANPGYAIATLEAAARGGADFLVLCDTNGGTLPWEVEAITASVCRSAAAPVGIHTHDDGGCGVANSLVAVRAGAVMVQGTVNGYGERVSNANLTTIVPDLQLKMGRRCVPPERLRELTELSRYVAEVANIPHDDYSPYVGRSAFAHKGGIHVAAMLKCPESYQHVEPALVGNEMRTVVSELSGRGNILHLAERQALATDASRAREVLERVKDLESKGYTFEGAEASVEMMLRRTHAEYRAPFQLVDFMVVVEHREGRGLFSEATVKVEVEGRLVHTAAEGNGPVNALSLALRKALADTHPEIQDVHLSDYKVRILDSQEGTAATTRVLIDFQKGARQWTTVGASTNIIEASWTALADAMEYAIAREREGWASRPEPLTGQLAAGE
ncbi:MAG TPA: citramalate synthase [Thermoanaerobaculia bacterium]|nr:citramalate synthase [Thermoanaerobaculia bacterium]